MKTWFRRGLRIGGILVAIYVALCVVARLGYPRVMFPAPSLAAVPPEFDPARTAPGRPVRIVTIPRGALLPTRGLWVGEPTKGAVLIFHGNGETMFQSAPVARALAERGFGVLAVEYTGYGLDHGPPPSEADLYADAEGAVDFLRDRGVPAEAIAALGFSLGSGVAVEMAGRGRVAKLVLVAPYTSMIDMGRRFAPILPVSLLIAHRLDSLGKADKVKVPTLVFHGDADEVVPFPMGQKLSGAIRGAVFVPVPGGHHNDLFYSGRVGSPSPGDMLDRIAAHLTTPR